MPEELELGSDPTFVFELRLYVHVIIKAAILGFPLLGLLLQVREEQRRVQKQSTQPLCIGSSPNRQDPWYRGTSS